MRGWLLTAWLMICVLPVALAQPAAPALTVEMTLSERAVVVGQPVTVSVRALDPLRVEGLRLMMPTLVDLGQTAPSDVRVSSQVIMGVVTVVYEQQIVVYPHRAGTFIVPPAQVIIPETPLSAARSAQSAPLTLTVTPLPQPAPPSFVNAVGELSVAAHVDRFSVAFEEPVTLTLTITGDGNLPLLLPPRLPRSEAWRVAAPQRQDHLAQNQVTFRWLLFPRRSGPVELPSLQFAWYDVRLARYQTFEAPTVIVNVGAGMPVMADVAPQMSSSTTETEAAATVSNLDLSSARPRVWPGPVYWFIPLLFSVGGMLIAALKAKPARRSTRRAARVDLRADLQRATQLPPAQAFPLLQAVLERGLAARCPAEHTLETWLSLMPAPLQTRLQALRQTLADARFAPATPQDVQQQAQAVVRILRQIDHYLEQA